MKRKYEVIPRWICPNSSDIKDGSGRQQWHCCTGCAAFWMFDHLSDSSISFSRNGKNTARGDEGVVELGEMGRQERHSVGGNLCQGS